MPKTKLQIILIGLSLLLAACSSVLPNVDIVHKKNQGNLAAKSATPTEIPAATPPAINPYGFCKTELGKLPGPYDKEGLDEVCKQIKQFDICHSVENAPIIHFDKEGSDLVKGKRILALSLIHGDETPSGSVTRAWMTRLQTIDPRNTWRVLPIANPDGVKTRTRYNARGVDLNRNFPSQDWKEKATPYWEKTTRRDPRRFPGLSPASEPETLCLVKHIEEFKPDFIISIHTPLGVLDFDGPRIANPGFKPLPWVGLGNFSGSLGRYMWVDSKVPVLTIELRGNSGIKRLEDFDQLQDISGTVAIQSGRILKQEARQ